MPFVSLLSFLYYNIFCQKNQPLLYQYNCYYEKTVSEVKNITDEIPFDIPDSWCWVRHNELFEISGGSQPPKAKFKDTPQTGFVRLFQIRDYGKNPQPIYISIDATTKTTKKGDILLARYGASLGKVFWAEDGAYNVAMAKVIPLFDIKTISNEYLFLYYKSSLYQDTIIGHSRSAQAGFNKDDLSKMFFVLPPLSEQIRIVNALKNIEPLIAEYDKMEQQATKLDDEIYDKLKKSILQYAIQGKLVPQNSNDEPAAVLLERIRAEKKAQLGKKYVESYIYKGDDNCYYEHINGKDIDITEDIPFDLPNEWAWARLINLCIDISDIDHNMPKSVENGVLFLSAKDLLNDGSINYTNNVKYISEEDYVRLSGKSKPQKGDIIYSRIGACLGKARIVKEDIRFLVSYSCCTIKPVLINKEYLRHILDDVFVLKQAKKKTQSIGVPDLGIAEIKKFRIPIPPLAEQKRIVEKIDEIFAKL